MADDVVTVEKVIHAQPEAIFALISDAARHPEFDGSGGVVKAKADAPERLGLGAVFGMSMKMGVPYSTVNTVIEYEENRRIAWQTAPRGFAGRFSGGRIWRYELEPADGGTRVQESWDVTKDKQRSMLKVIAAKQMKRAMEKTLDRIEEITVSS